MNRYHVVYEIFYADKKFYFRNSTSIESEKFNERCVETIKKQICGYFKKYEPITEDNVTILSWQKFD